MQGVKEDLHERVGVVALQLILTRIPTSILAYMRTALRIVEKLVGRPAEILLAMCVIAFAPIVNGRVAYRAEGCLVAVEHELVVAEDALQIVQVVCEALLAHESPHQRASLGPFCITQSVRKKQINNNLKLMEEGCGSYLPNGKG